MVTEQLTCTSVSNNLFENLSPITRCRLHNWTIIIKYLDAPLPYTFGWQIISYVRMPQQQASLRKQAQYNNHRNNNSNNNSNKNSNKNNRTRMTTEKRATSTTTSTSQWPQQQLYNNIKNSRHNRNKHNISCKSCSKQTTSSATIWTFMQLGQQQVQQQA